MCTLPAAAVVTRGTAATARSSACLGDNERDAVLHRAYKLGFVLGCTSGDPSISLDVDVEVGFNLLLNPLEVLGIGLDDRDGDDLRDLIRM